MRRQKVKLSEHDATLFFDLMFSLQLYVKGQLGLFSEVKTLAAYRELTSEKRMEVRNAVWDNPHMPYRSAAA